MHRNEKVTELSAPTILSFAIANKVQHSGQFLSTSVGAIKSETLYESNVCLMRLVSPLSSILNRSQFYVQFSILFENLCSVNLCES